MVVRGTNLKTATGSSYLWWLNGSNHGTQVAPAAVETITLDDKSQVVVAWNMATSGIYENFGGERPSVCMGQTIFGLTSTTGTSDIYDINFTSSVADYIGQATGIHTPSVLHSLPAVYDLAGRRLNDVPKKGAYISGNRKLIVR